MQAFRNTRKVIFPVVALPKGQLVGPTAPKVKLIHSVTVPEYQTEMDVTRAIASGTFKGFATEAYEAAKRYQQAIKPRFYRRASKEAKPVGINFVPGYASL